MERNTQALLALSFLRSFRLIFPFRLTNSFQLFSFQLLVTFPDHESFRCENWAGAVLTPGLGQCSLHGKTGGGSSRDGGIVRDSCLVLHSHAAQARTHRRRPPEKGSGYRSFSATDTLQAFHSARACVVHGGIVSQLSFRPIRSGGVPPQIASPSRSSRSGAFWRPLAHDSRWRHCGTARHSGSGPGPCHQRGTATRRDGADFRRDVSRPEGGGHANHACSGTRRGVAGISRQTNGG